MLTMVNGINGLQRIAAASARPFHCPPFISDTRHAVKQSMRYCHPLPELSHYRHKGLQHCNSCCCESADCLLL